MKKNFNIYWGQVPSVVFLTLDRCHFFFNKKIIGLQEIFFRFFFF